MEINASCKYDRKAVRALCHMLLSKKTDPRARMGLIAVADILLAAILVVLCVQRGGDRLPIVLLAVLVASMLIEAWIYFITPRRQYAALGALRDVVNRYTFREDRFRAVREAVSWGSETEMTYASLVRVVETKAYLFLFQTKNQTYIVDKSTLSPEDMAELRRSMAVILGKRYSIRKY